MKDEPDIQIRVGMGCPVHVSAVLQDGDEVQQLIDILTTIKPFVPKKFDTTPEEGGE